MKGLLVTQETSDRMDDVTRIVVKDKENLAFIFTDGGLIAITGFKFKNCEVIGEVDVPESVIEAALDYVHAKKILNSFSELVWKLIP